MQRLAGWRIAIVHPAPLKHIKPKHIIHRNPLRFAVEGASHGGYRCKG